MLQANLSTTLSKKEKKRLYDLEYRRKNKEKIKDKKKAYYQTESGKAASKRNRDKMKKYHAEYCRTPEYRLKKHEYDSVNWYVRKYGEYWECMQIVEKIEKKVIQLVPDKYERSKMRGVVDRQIKRCAYKRHLILGWKYNY